jgi:hypothetical protein
MGVIDEGAIDRLFLVGELTKNVCLHSGEFGAAQCASERFRTAEPMG